MSDHFSNSASGANGIPEQPPPREQYGFRRTECGCALCSAPCRHMPGSLDVADLERLCPEGHELFAWAELHLRAVTDKPYPTLVPVRQANGHCHWLVDGRCAVHENAPYGCAFFDLHQSDSEVAQRSAATIRARQEDAASNGLYYRLWLYLCQRGLIVPSGNRAAVIEEVKFIHRLGQRQQRRLLS
jgi:hypothetical protein